MATVVPDFTRYLNDVQQIFEAYYSYDDRTERDNSIKVAPKIEAIFQIIGEQVTQQTPFESKAQALSATIEIAVWILKDSNKSLLAHHIREDLPWMPLKTTISHILDVLLPEELAALQADGEIPKAIRYLRTLAQDYALDLFIDDSIDRLWLEESDQED